jgi:hypothetical protein
MLSETSALAHEWSTLQNNHEQHESNCLLIKLCSAAVFVACFALALDAAIAVAVMLVLWVQEGITRTVQSRLGERLLRVELLLRQASPQLAYACQLHTEWQAARPGFTGLLAEYAKSMLRPTVAFPHVVLTLLAIGSAVLR